MGAGVEAAGGTIRRAGGAAQPLPMAGLTLLERLEQASRCRKPLQQTSFTSGLTTRPNRPPRLPGRHIRRTEHTSAAHTSTEAL